MIKPTFLLILFILITSHTLADITGKVIHISDGDTLTVLQGEKKYRIRLYGIDCPEWNQPFGYEAKTYTSNAVFGKKVTIVTKDIDKHDRIVGLLYADNRCLNEALVANGLAWVHKWFCKNCSKWQSLQNKAKKNTIGLWQQSNPVPPWSIKRGQKYKKK